MRFVRVIIVPVLCLFVATLSSADEPKDRKRERKPKQETQVEENRQSPSRRTERETDRPPERVQREQPRHVQQETTPRRQPERVAPPNVQHADRSPQVYRDRREAQAWQQQRGWLRQGGWQGHSNWERTRARHWEREHLDWRQRGGYGGYYIPQNQFSLHFGQHHPFRIQARPVMYMGYPRFMYGGFSFLLLDPWPEYWADDWYEADDVYVEYDDGYYLHNLRHPGPRIAISVVF